MRCLIGWKARFGAQAQMTPPPMPIAPALAQATLARSNATESSSRESRGISFTKSWAAAAAAHPPRRWPVVVAAAATSAVRRASHSCSSSSRKPLRSSPHLLTFILFLTRNGGARVDKALSASYCLMVCGGHPVGLVGIPASAHRMAHRTSCSNCNVWETICNRFQLWPLRDHFKPNAFLFTIDAEIEHG